VRTTQSRSIALEEAVTTKPDLTACYEALAKLYLRSKNYDRPSTGNKALDIDTTIRTCSASLAESYEEG